ncbi:MAG: 50S ribosomal protein L6 [Clostridiales bacterium]|jgi:large subunit ribosomal protein L6|nr:50S ribosomal protein L6 [Clostridiales bacterium]
MSRIGRMPIPVPAGVEVKIDGAHVAVKGKLGELTHTVNHAITVKLEDGVLHVTRAKDDDAAIHGLERSLLANMVHGVSTGFEKKLEINGVGYRASKDGKNLVMNLGYSHQVIMPEIPGITIEVRDQTHITIKGPDKQAVGQFAAEVREKRPPEPYQGKGIKYADETILRKEGKTGGKKK